jgi:hypothetical protein
MHAHSHNTARTCAHTRTHTLTSLTRTHACTRPGPQVALLQRWAHSHSRFAYGQGLDGYRAVAAATSAGRAKAPPSAASAAPGAGDGPSAGGGAASGEPSRAEGEALRLGKDDHILGYCLEQQRWVEGLQRLDGLNWNV